MKNSLLKKLTSTLILLCIIFSLAGCESSSHTAKSSEIFALDTLITLTAYGEAPDAYLEAGKTEIRRLESLFSVTKSSSDIAKANAAKGEKTEVSSETYALLLKAQEISKLTDGKFDPTLRNLTILWGFGTEDTHVPSKNEIEACLLTTGAENLILSENNVTLKNDSELDLGGIAKGYIADKAAEAMQNAGMTYGIIDLGGNVRTIGEKPDKSPWKVGVKYPDTNSRFLIIECKDTSLVTSGGYQRTFTENGKAYHHILNPETGYPAESDIKSVTVIGKDGALCDGLSTALFVGGTDFAKELYLKEKSFDFIILTKNDEILATETLKGKLSLEADYSNLEIIYI